MSHLWYGAYAEKIQELKKEIYNLKSQIISTLFIMVFSIIQLFNLEMSL